MTRAEAKAVAKMLAVKHDTIGIDQIRAYLNAEHPDLIGYERDRAEEALCRAICELAI